MHSLYTYPLMFLALGTSLLGCTSKEQADDATSLPAAADSGLRLSAEQESLANIRTGGLQYRVLSETIACSGELEVPPQGWASVSVPLGGFLEASPLMVGTQVNKGQVLARLSSPELISLQQSYLETQSELQFAEQEWQRQQQLGEQQATATKKLQQSQADRNRLQSRLNGLKASLALAGLGTAALEGGTIQSQLVLRAPISGTITQVHHHQGQFVESREVLYEIVNQQHLQLQLQVFEQDIARIRPGQQLSFSPMGSSQQYTANVSHISPRRQEAERTYSIHAQLQEQQSQLKPGLFVAAQILLSPDSVAVVPEKALVYSQSKPHVLVAQNGTYQLQAVRIGLKQEGWVQILNVAELEQKELVLDGASRLFAAMQRE